MKVNALWLFWPFYLIFAALAIMRAFTLVEPFIQRYKARWLWVKLGSTVPYWVKRVAVGQVENERYHSINKRLRNLYRHA